MKHSEKFTPESHTRVSHQSLTPESHTRGLFNLESVLAKCVFIISFFVLIISCNKDQFFKDQIVKPEISTPLELRNVAGLKSEDQKKISAFFDRKELLEFTSIDDYSKFFKLCTDNIDYLIHEIEADQIKFKSPFRDYIKAEQELNLVQSQNNLVEFKNKWKNRVTIVEDGINPLFVMYHMNILCNNQGIVKIESKYRKYNDKFLAISDQIEALNSINESSFNDKIKDVIIIKLKSSFEQNKTGFRSISGDLTCSSTSNNPVCNKRRILGKLDWQTNDIYNNLGNFQRTEFYTQAVTKYQYLSLTWLNRDADSITASLSHRLVYDNGLGSTETESNSRNNSKIAIATIDNAAFPLIVDIINNNSNHFSKRAECNNANLLNMRCSNNQSW